MKKRTHLGHLRNTNAVAQKCLGPSLWVGFGAASERVAGGAIRARARYCSARSRCRPPSSAPDIWPRPHGRVGVAPSAGPRCDAGAARPSQPLRLGASDGSRASRNSVRTGCLECCKGTVPFPVLWFGKCTSFGGRRMAEGPLLGRRNARGALLSRTRRGACTLLHGCRDDCDADGGCT